MVLAKWLQTEPEIFLFDEPTRGIDVGAKYDIYKLINELATNGKAIVLITSEMEEVIGISDRIIVMCEGKLAGELSGNDISQENIMMLASPKEVLIN